MSIASSIITSTASSIGSFWGGGRGIEVEWSGSMVVEGC